jgi:hypothetical protein
MGALAARSVHGFIGRPDRGKDAKEIPPRPINSISPPLLTPSAIVSEEGPQGSAS